DEEHDCRGITGGQPIRNCITRQSGYTCRMPATQSAAAPGRLEVVRRFVNTCDIDAGNDTLATPEACLRWLRGQDLLARSVDTLDRADRDEVVAFRESLRDVLGVHRNGRLGDAVLDRLNATAARVGLAVRFIPSGS